MANTSITIVQATRLLLQTSARVFYRGLSENAKASLRANFFAADKQGEGRISFQDFLNSRYATQDPASIGLFRFLDADGTGYLELDEFIMLHYINESGAFFCDSCGVPIITGGYSCTECPPPGRNSFDICISCYAAPAPAFKHHHPRTSFVNLVANFQQSGAICKSTMPSYNNMQSREAAVHDRDESGLIFNCDCCGVNIITERYTCKECVNSFDLCLSCYSSRPPYFRHHHPYSSFMRKVQSPAAAARVAAMNARNADRTNAYNMAAMGHLNHNPYNPNYAAPHVQSNSKIDAGIDLLGKLVDFSMQSGLFNN